MEGEPLLYIGLMSGTSVDAVDCAIVRCSRSKTELLATHSHPIPDPLKIEIAALCQAADNDIQRMGELDRAIGYLFGEATLELLANAAMDRIAIRAIGSHGQTVRHVPPSSGASSASCFSLQIGDPNTIAEVTGICTVADFRRRDIAAGGEGAPLAPVFHAAAFSDPTKTRAIVNIGGIANATLLQGRNLLKGFDTGPGNTLLDQWFKQHQPGDYDHSGAWAAGGKVSQALLAKLASHTFLGQTGPRSTGREAFNMPWLLTTLDDAAEISVQDVQATLSEFTAQCVFNALDAEPVKSDEIYLCGGGAHNLDLVARLQKLFKPRTVESTAALGMHPDWVEAVAFAWLAHQTMSGLTGNAAQVTGAEGDRILGGIYQA